MMRKLFIPLILLGSIVAAVPAFAQDAIIVANEAVTGTTINKLAKLTGAPSTAIITATTDTDNITGIVVGTPGTTGNAIIAVLGAPNCVFDATPVVSGDYVTNSSTVAGACHDAGATRPTGTQVIGRALQSGGGGSTINVAMQVNFANTSGSGSPGGSSGDFQDNNGSGGFGAAHMNDNGTIIRATLPFDVATNPVIAEYTNAGTTGTTLNKLVKLTGAPSTAVITATTDTDNSVGICTGNCTTSGVAQVAYLGQAVCVFDGATTAGDWVTISSTTAGDCHDAGASRPTASQAIGRVLSTNGGGGSYAVTLAIGFTNTAGGGSGTVNSGNSGQLGYYATTGTAISGNANANISGGTVTLGQAGSVVGGVAFVNASSGSITLGPPTGALGTVTATLPINTGTIAELNLGQNFTAVQQFSASPIAADVTTSALTEQITNNGSTGPTQNKLAKLTGAPSTATIAATTDIDGIIGICTGNCTTTGNAQISVTGTAACVFDGATTAGDWVQISTSTAGDCHDTGSANFPSGDGQVIGRVIQTIGGAGNANVALQNRTAGTTRPTAFSNGTASSGTKTIDCTHGPIQSVTNGGAFTLAMASNDGTCVLRVTNNASAGAITFSGFSEGSNTGDALDTTNGHIFDLALTRIGGNPHYLISALQ